jgi:hypothetical protein
MAWGADSAGLYVADRSRFTITEMGYNDSVQTHYVIGRMVNRVHQLAPKRYLLKTVSEENPRRQVFRIVNISTESATTPRYPLPTVPNDWALDGVLARNERGQSFYVSQWAGHFFSINSLGDFLYQKETIDRTPPPKIMEAQGTMRMDPKARLVNFSISVHERYLYILSRVGLEDDEKSGIIDLYEVASGEYVCSVLVPRYQGQDVSAIAVEPNGLFAIQGKMIVHYRFQNRSTP